MKINQFEMKMKILNFLSSDLGGGTRMTIKTSRLLTQFVKSLIKDNKKEGKL